MSAREVVGIILGIVVLILLEWLVGLYLWGAIAVAIFGLPSLNAWQFLGLLVLVKILFGSGSKVKTTNSGGND